MIDIALAMFLGAAGVLCLHGAWRQQLPAAMQPVQVGWIGLALAGFSWMRGTGAEFGTALMFFMPPLFAWALIAKRAQWREPLKRKRETSGNGTPATTVRWLHHSAMLLLTVPVSGLAAAYFSIGLASLLPATALTRMTVAVISMPMLWGCAAYWAGTDERLMRPAAGIITLGAAGAAVAYLVPA